TPSRSRWETIEMLQARVVAKSHGEAATAAKMMAPPVHRQDCGIEARMGGACRRLRSGARAAGARPPLGLRGRLGVGFVVLAPVRAVARVLVAFHQRVRHVVE